MRYPVTTRRSVIDCPVHECSVALDGAGRIASACPECKREARKAMRRWSQRRRRWLAVA